MNTMYIMKKDYQYFTYLLKSFDPTCQNQFLILLKRIATASAGKEIRRIRVVENTMIFEPQELVTRGMINKIYAIVKKVAQQSHNHKDHI